MTHSEQHQKIISICSNALRNDQYGECYGFLLLKDLLYDYYFDLMKLILSGHEESETLQRYADTAFNYYGYVMERLSYKVFDKLNGIKK